MSTKIHLTGEKHNVTMALHSTRISRGFLFKVFNLPHIICLFVDVCFDFSLAK